MFMSALRPGQMLPESCGCQTPPSFPAKTSDSGEGWTRLSWRDPNLVQGEEVLVADLAPE
jgi:hypothetical protein